MEGLVYSLIGVSWVPVSDRVKVAREEGSSTACILEVIGSSRVMFRRWVGGDGL